MKEHLDWGQDNSCPSWENLRMSADMLIIMVEACCSLTGASVQQFYKASIEVEQRCTHNALIKTVLDECMDRGGK